MSRQTTQDEGVPAEFGTYKAADPLYEGLTRHAVHITMRDGVKLAAEIVLPKNLPPDVRLPALLSQTRYWRRKELRAPFKWFLEPEILEPHVKDFQPFFTSHGYAIVLLDVRGTGASFGAWPHPWAEDSVFDQGEVVDWIVAQPWSNGRVGGYGISYLGTTAELLAVPNHPAVKATVPMFNHPDPYTDIAFPGGVFNERFIRSWGDFDRNLDDNVVPKEYGWLGRLTLKGVKPVDADRDRQLLDEAVRAHAENGHAFRLAEPLDYRDERPKGMELSVDGTAVHRFKEKIERSNTISFGFGSWMDAGTADAVLRRFMTFQNAQRAVIGAWEHEAKFHASPYQSPDAPPNPGLHGQWLEMLRFFDAHLKDLDNGVGEEKALFYYTLGEERWKKTGVWPPEGTRTQRWYLREDNLLSTDKPSAETGSDRYTVDFEATTGDANRWWEMGAVLGKTVVYRDRAADAKSLLTYTTPPLAEDTEITGYPVIALYVTSTETDGAFYVYLEDVHPSGRVVYVTEGQLRAIHRKISGDDPHYALQVPHHSFKTKDALPLVPGEIAEISFGLHPTSVLIREGHRIRIGIAGYDKGTFIRIPAEGTPVISVHRDSVHASCVDLPVVQRRR